MRHSGSGVLPLEGAGYKYGVGFKKKKTPNSQRQTPNIQRFQVRRPCRQYIRETLTQKCITLQEWGNEGEEMNVKYLSAWSYEKVVH